MVTREQLLENSHQLAIKSLQLFFNKIGLNSDFFEQIYQIPISNGTVLRQNRVAEYNYYNNMIKINEKKIDNIVNNINERKNAELTATIKIATELIHELVHAMRTTSIKDPYTGIVEKKLISASYQIKPGEDEEYVSNRIDYQISLDEIITDALSEVIIKLKNSEESSIDSVIESLQAKSEYPTTKVGLKIINAIGEDKIENLKWFVTAAYQENYEDLFEETFNEEYEDLLYYANDIYTSDYCEEDLDQESIIQIEEIIDKKKEERLRK